MPVSPCVGVYPIVTVPSRSRILHFWHKSPAVVHGTSALYPVAALLKGSAWLAGAHRLNGKRTAKIQPALTWVGFDRKTGSVLLLKVVRPIFSSNAASSERTLTTFVLQIQPSHSLWWSFFLVTDGVAVAEFCFLAKPSCRALRPGDLKFVDIGVIIGDRAR